MLRVDQDHIPKTAQMDTTWENEARAAQDKRYVLDMGARHILQRNSPVGNRLLPPYLPPWIKRRKQSKKQQAIKNGIHSDY